MCRVGNRAYRELLGGFVAEVKGDGILVGYPYRITAHGIGDGEQAAGTHHPNAFNQVDAGRIEYLSAQRQLCPKRLARQ